MIKRNELEFGNDYLINRTLDNLTKYFENNTDKIKTALSTDGYYVIYDIENFYNFKEDKNNIVPTIKEKLKNEFGWEFVEIGKNWYYSDRAFIFYISEDLMNKKRNEYDAEEKRKKDEYEKLFASTPQKRPIGSGSIDSKKSLLKRFLCIK